MMIKNFLLVVGLFFSCFIIAQDNSDKIVTVANNACECISKIDTSIDKTQKSKEIKECISSANMAYQLEHSLVEINNELEQETVKENDSTNLESYTISLGNKDQAEIEEYLYDTCGNMKSIYFSDDAKSKNSTSDKEEALEFYNEGLYYSENDNFEKAIEYYKRAIEKDRKFAFAWDNMGIAYRRLGKYKEAIKCYEKSLKIDKKGKMPLMNIAVAYEYLKEYDKAIKSYDKYAKIHKNDPESFYGLGRIYFLKGSYENALDNIMQAYWLYVEMESPYKRDAEKMIGIMYQELQKEGKLDLFNRMAKKHNIQINTEN